MIPFKKCPVCGGEMVEKEVEKLLNNHGRIVLRPSGTEPLVRVMVEGDNANKIKQLANQLVDVISSEIVA